MTAVSVRAHLQGATTPPATPSGAVPASLPGPSDPEHVKLPASYQPLQFHMGTGGQVAGGVIGAIAAPVGLTLAAGILGIASALLNSEGGANGFLDALPEGPRGGYLLAGVGIAVVAAGAVSGVFINRALQKSSFDKRELAREDQQVGKPIDRFSLEFLTPYDHSGDGSIQLKNSTGLPDRDEKLTFQTQDYTTKSFHFDPGDHDVLGGNPFGDTTTQHGTQQRAISAANVWAAADTNRDDTVTRAELSTLSKRYDANKDGFLSAGERKQLTEEHPLLEGGWTVTEPAH